MLAFSENVLSGCRRPSHATARQPRRAADVDDFSQNIYNQDPESSSCGFGALRWWLRGFACLLDGFSRPLYPFITIVSTFCWKPHIFESNLTISNTRIKMHRMRELSESRRLREKGGRRLWFVVQLTEVGSPRVFCPRLCQTGQTCSAGRRDASACQTCCLPSCHSHLYLFHSPAQGSARPKWFVSMRKAVGHYKEAESFSKTSL